LERGRGKKDKIAKDNSNCREGGKAGEEGRKEERNLSSVKIGYRNVEERTSERERPP
jgi:hypothetical protein